MAMTLPPELVWVFNLVGVSWPEINEDDVHKAASELRTIAQKLDSDTGDAKKSSQKMLQNNSSESLKKFEKLSSKLSDEHLPKLQEGMGLLADGLDASAGLVVGLKVAAIAELVALAAEIIADQAAAPFTFGASEAAIPAEIAATRVIMKRVFKEAVDAVEGTIMDIVMGEVMGALGSAAADLAMELVTDGSDGEEKAA